MGLITLISDMGTTDHYVASVKAALFNLAPDSTVVDISHQVRPFDIYQAGFLLRSVWQQFPAGTVHVIGVRPEQSAEHPHLAVQYMNHYFVGSDSGIFGLLFDDTAEHIYQINLAQGDDWNFPMRGVLAVSAAHLSKGGAPEFLGPRLPAYRKAMPVTPLVDGDKILAHVVHIDHYGNVYTDVSRRHFEAVRRGRNFSVIPRRSSFKIRRISTAFHEMVEGDAGAIWAANDHLMIVIRNGVTGHGGGAAQLFGFQLNELVRIEFHGEAHR
jgi:S-adenosyl-L-methionine hydrolase (adenosine-forming)